MSAPNSADPGRQRSCRLPHRPRLWWPPLHFAAPGTEIVGATEDLARAERTWTAVATQLDRNYLETQRRRADAGTTTTRAARARLERALDGLQVATERLH